MSWSDSRGDRGADTGKILAAGCVLWRRSPHGGGLEIALVHRPRYDGLVPPQGQAEARRGRAARRGARGRRGRPVPACAPGVVLPTLHYMAKGRPKEVRYWAAEAVDDETFVPNREVDRLLWLPPDAARLRLSYDHDRTLIDALPHALRPS
ncbi:DNA mismatch repair protein MutT OS=Streptomyces antimycoticus OX=68175 GN=SSPO_055140 PE=4 SV=1 [Streptomyces antimycoticus]